MQRIATGDGRFAAGNPALGTPGTMVTSVYMNSLQDEICNVITEAGLELDGEDTQQLLKAITAMIFAYAPLVLPTTPSVQKTAGLIFVTDRLQFKTWVTGPNYTGYRSLDCGNIGGVMRLAPPPGMMEAEGDIFDGDDEPALVGIYKDNGLVVPVADWEPKTGKLADMGDGTYRAPDVRDMFMRFTGTDLDTANARELGSEQAQASPEHKHISPVNDVATSASLQIARGSTWEYGATQIGRPDCVTVSNSVSISTSGEDSWLFTGPPVIIGGDGRPGNIARLPVVCL